MLLNMRDVICDHISHDPLQSSQVAEYSVTFNDNKAKTVEGFEHTCYNLNFVIDKSMVFLLLLSSSMGILQNINVNLFACGPIEK